MILMYSLTMPNRASWNGKWSGDEEGHFVEVNATQSYASAKVDLCPDCQKAVYEFIFGKEEER